MEIEIKYASIHNMAYFNCQIATCNGAYKFR